MTHMPDDTTLIQTHNDEEYVMSVLETIGRQLEAGEINYDEVERMLLSNQSPGVRADIGLTHHFCNGVYMREMFAPAGSLMLGHAHSEKALNIVLKGCVRMFADNVFKEVRAPQVLVSEPHVRKLGYVVEDLTWINVIATETTNVEDIEKRFIIKSPAYLDWETSKLI